MRKPGLCTQNTPTDIIVSIYLFYCIRFLNSASRMKFRVYGKPGMPDQPGPSLFSRFDMSCLQCLSTYGLNTRHKTNMITKRLPGSLLNELRMEHYW